MKRSKTPKYAATLAELARIEKVSRATTTRWDRAGIISWTDDDPPRIDLAGTRQLLRELSNSKSDPEIRQARLEILRAEAKLRELRLRQKEGELVETARVDFVMKDAFIGIRSGFRGLVPWLGAEIMALPRENASTRSFFNRIDERLDIVIFSAYVAQVRALAELANRSGGKAEKMAAQAWKEAFPDDWQAEYDRLEKSGEIGRTVPDNKPSRNSDRKRNAK